MRKQLYPCIWFDGKALAAAEWYCKVFANSKVNTNNGMVVDFELCGRRIIGLNGGPKFQVNPSISFFIKHADKNRIQAIWDQLSAGGKIRMDLQAYPWSAYYGWVQDIYGVSWQLMLEPAAVGDEIFLPSLLFANNVLGKAEEAVDFYVSIFEGSAKTLTVHYPADNPHAGKLMYGEYTLGTTPFIAMDGPGSHDFVFNEGVSFVVNCDSQAEIDFYWNCLLANGGEESMCGWLKDRYGVSWQIVPSQLPQLMNDPHKREKVIDAFRQMRKFDLNYLLSL
jgi:predicted 3-demethylubiquinone-9 3-methyltransferase (glyoxalase superfamily)